MTVVCWVFSRTWPARGSYVRVRSILKDANFRAAAALRHLAAITDFDLFVSTTFDPLLENAV